MDTPITIHTDRRTGRSALFVRTSHGEVAAEWTLAGWRISALTTGRPSCEGVETLLEMEATPRWAAWLARNVEATAEATAVLAAARPRTPADRRTGLLRMEPLARLALQGGPATGGARWIATGGTVGVCVAMRVELLSALGEGDASRRLPAAHEILARPREHGAESRGYAVTTADRGRARCVLAAYLAHVASVGGAP